MGQLPDEMPYAEEAAEEAIGQIEMQQQGQGMPLQM
jgi:hypothetical protein